jgi:ribonuclease P protein component
LPRHEEDLPAEEGQEKSDPRLPAAGEHGWWEERAEAAPWQGAEAARAERPEEVGSRAGVRLAKAAHLTLRGEFLAVQERGRKIVTGPYVVLALATDRGRARLGVTVSKKVGTAVVRNRVKRWVREAFRSAAAELPSVDVVVIARSGAPAGGLAAARRALAVARGGRAT